MIFIFGATGFIGAGLTEFFVEKNTDIKLAVRAPELKDQYLFDLESTKIDVSYVQENDTVVLLSAISSPDRCEKDYDYSYGINVTQTSKVISTLLERKARVLFASSDTVYGGLEGVECNENTEVNPLGNYAKMKAEVERKFAHEPNFVSMRFSYVWGGNDRFSSLLKEHIRNGQELSIFSGFERSVVSIEDVAKGICILHSLGSIEKYKVINFSGPQCISRECMANIALKDYSLNYKVVEPEISFWNGRARKINMKSIYFSSLLGREPSKYKPRIGVSNV